MHTRILNAVINVNLALFPREAISAEALVIRKAVLAYRFVKTRIGVALVLLPFTILTWEGK